MDNSQQETQAARRARISYACEACRAAKVKCQPSSQSGICRRCSDSKRECIFKTGPRTRRPPYSRHCSFLARQIGSPSRPTVAQPLTQPSPSSTTSTPRAAVPPPPGPSKTFTIDIPMQDEDADLAENLEFLRCSHEMFVDGLLPGDDDEESYYSCSDEEGEPASSHHQAGSVAGASSVSHASSLPVGASALSTPPSSVSFGTAKSKKKGALASLGVRPQFNLDSAEKLLAEFESRMLLHFPAVVQAQGEFSVPKLAQTKPFVLLAILAAASGSRTLQGHSLYDEEFRKVLGLKFVASGERSLELLQGLMVYTAWYPFHLRPKNKQAFQYVRMVVDIVNDLELDQDPDSDDMPSEKVTKEGLEEIRTYLATYYFVSSFAAAWNRTPALSYTKYTAKCCAILERDSTIKGDHILAWLVRIQHILEEVNDLRKTRRSGGLDEYQISLMLKGMESQLTEWETRMSPELSSTASIRLSLLFAKIFIPGAPLLKLPMMKAKRPSNQTAGDTTTFAAEPARLVALVPDLRTYFDLLLNLPASELNSFSGPEWARFILIVILAFRLSFPIPDCPEWDDGWAREEIGFGEYLKRFENMGHEPGGSGNKDVLSASKVVLGVVRKKWEKRAARINRQKGKGVALGGPARQNFGAEMPLDMGLDLSLDAGMDPMLLDTTMQGCPMMDGSLESYYPLWDESFSSADLGSVAVDEPGAGIAGGPPMPVNEYLDIWGAMTTGWAQWPQPHGGFEGGDLP
ncbi:hypothetical protein CONLIGDRAFT_573489 [Coniochaeta ligniaria NRRL 30616]|uniref:Zn(2)-C6 fungal-type domain-containing protein n=1 Tax=Coniochaeta ligniaria NRRL 30616 TaxID=1408157 RepID=A0A1J7IV06_9PEZI|nr:hypothetical protein CONLIGDRAFT_573489 [Coniochaeta ligniaria NRRL 30616]